MLSEVQLWKASLDELKAQILGHTDVKLEGNETICRQYECNLGSTKINQFSLKSSVVTDPSGPGVSVLYRDKNMTDQVGFYFKILVFPTKFSGALHN